MSHSISVILPNYNGRNIHKKNTPSQLDTIEKFERLYLATTCTNNTAKQEQKCANQRFNKTHHLQQPGQQIISIINKTPS